MTQKHTCRPEGLQNRDAGHRGRHAHDLRSVALGDDYFVECAYKATSKSQDPKEALAEWRRSNRPARSARLVPAMEIGGSAVQFNLCLADYCWRTTERWRGGGNHGRR